MHPNLEDLIAERAPKKLEPGSTVFTAQQLQLLLEAVIYWCAESLRAFETLLDHPLERSGVGQTEWQGLRVKFWRLYDLWTTK